MGKAKKKKKKECMKIGSDASKVTGKEGNKRSPVLFALVAVPHVAEYQQGVWLLPRASSPLFCWRFSLKLYLLTLVGNRERAGSFLLSSTHLEPDWSATSGS